MNKDELDRLRMWGQNVQVQERIREHLKDRTKADWTQFQTMSRPNNCNPNLQPKLASSFVKKTLLLFVAGIILVGCFLSVLYITKGRFDSTSGMLAGFIFFMISYMLFLISRRILKA